MSFKERIKDTTTQCQGMKKCGGLFYLTIIALIVINYLSKPIISSESKSNQPTSSDKKTNANELLECVYIDPKKNMEEWDAYDSSKCQLSVFQPNDSVNAERYRHGEKYYSYNAYISDLIGARRDLSHINTHERCAAVKHEIGDLQANIIIIYHNEAFSVLIRMINSIISLTPANVLRRIVLYDDFSDEKLQVDKYLRQYIQLKASKKEAHSLAWTTKVKMYRAKKREGLIRAKIFASRLIHDGDKEQSTEEENKNILVFLDSHCEVTKGWIEPLLSPILEDPKSMILPVVDLIDPYKLEYSKAMIARGSFDWGLKFSWEYFDWSYFNDLDNYVRSFKTIVPSGGLLAISEKFFRHIGEYDKGMEIWGAENVELAVRVWLCGGKILTMPCSRVGHIFRKRRPYSAKPGIDTNLFNSLRTVSVWFDDYKYKFFEFRPNAKMMETGNLTDRILLKETLKCHPFSWFIENVHPALKPAYDPKKIKSKAKEKPQKPVKTEL